MAKRHLEVGRGTHFLDQGMLWSCDQSDVHRGPLLLAIVQRTLGERASLELPWDFFCAENRQMFTQEGGTEVS